MCRTTNVTNSYALDCVGKTNLLHQTLWPNHCIKNTLDASLHSDLIVKDDDVIIRKGHPCNVGRPIENRNMYTQDSFEMEYQYFDGISYSVILGDIRLFYVIFIR